MWIGIGGPLPFSSSPIIYGARTPGFTDPFRSMVFFFIGGSLARSQDLWLFDSLMILTPVLIRSFGCFSLIYWPDARLLAGSLDLASLGRMMCELGDGRRTTQPSEKELEIDAD